MNKGYFITEDQMREALEYIAERYAFIDDEKLDEAERAANLDQWRGARRVLRRMGFKLYELETELA